MTHPREPRQRLERASFVALGSAAMFGFGPVSVGYFAQIAGVTDLSASVRVTTLYFFAVYLFVVLFGLLLRVRSFTIPYLWRMLSARGRALLAAGREDAHRDGSCRLARPARPGRARPAGRLPTIEPFRPVGPAMLSSALRSPPDNLPSCALLAGAGPRLTTTGCA